MKIGLIIYSQTGKTASVAVKLADRLSAAGHEVNLERVEVVGRVTPGTQDVHFKTIPDPGPYDAIVFGSPVQAFSLCVAMASYLKQIPSLQGKNVACMVTEFFPFPWMGGNQAIGQMSALCEAKGATVSGTGIVNWSNPRRKQMIEEVVDRLSSLPQFR